MKTVAGIALLLTVAGAAAQTIQTQAQMHARVVALYSFLRARSWAEREFGKEPRPIESFFALQATCRYSALSKSLLIDSGLNVHG